MDLITLAAAKTYANKVAAGFSSVSVEGSTIHFTLNDGQKVDMTIPTPENGVSVSNVQINEEGHLICTLSNGEVIDAGVIPKGEGGVSASINGITLAGDLSSVELGIIDDENISDLSTYSSKMIQQKLNSMVVVSELVGTESEPIIASELELGTYVISGVVQSSSTNLVTMNVPRKEYSVNKDIADVTVLWDNNPYTTSQYFIAFYHNEGEPLVKTIELVTKEELHSATLDCGEF